MPRCKKKVEVDWGRRNEHKEIVKFKDIDIYRRLIKIGRRQQKKRDKGIKLGGDRAERLMQHDGHKRVGRRIKQVKWGG